jgi:hypothetical protein
MNLSLILKPTADVPPPQIETTSSPRFDKSLSLPPEVRNTIYELFLVNDNPIPIASPHSKYYWEGNPLVLSGTKRAELLCLCLLVKGE